MTIQAFQQLVLKFCRKYGRRDLPWRTTRDPWAILVSEVMMQQTQVARGIERFPRFMKRFPTVEILARSSQASVLKEWLGLGYNRRALNLHRAAKMIVAEYDGKIPSIPEELIKLPGIGPYTANAIAAFAFNKPVVVLDTNIRRVFLYHFFSRKESVIPDFDLESKNKKQKESLSSRSFAYHPPEDTADPRIKNRHRKDLRSFGFLDSRFRGNDGVGSGNDKMDNGSGVLGKISDFEIVPIIQKTLYHKNPRMWYSALMDYGALGDFGENPNRTSAHYVKQSRFEGSRRFVRAKLVSYISNHVQGTASYTLETYIRSLPNVGTYDVGDILRELKREGFVVLEDGLWKAKE